MADSVSVTSHHSYGSRVGNSFKSILGGIILVIASIVLLAWNEKNYVEQKAALKEGASLVNETSSDQINSELEGKEVHLYGDTSSNASALEDNIFGITTDDLKLKRTVEMYQWYEESEEHCTDNYGGSEDCTTTYNYRKKWSDDAINSSSFYESAGHNNPSNREYNSTEQEKSPITLGVYTLTPIFTNQLDNYKTINLTEQNIKIPGKYQGNPNSLQETPTENIVENNNDNYLYGDTKNTGNRENAENKENDEGNTVSNTNSSISNENFHILNDYIYIGKNPNEPTVGDLKITFSSVKPGTVSIVGKQMGNELSSYTVSNGRSIALLSQGNVSAEDMFLAAQKANKMMTRIIRLIGLFLMYCGFAAMFKFIETLAKVLPFLANIIGVGTSIIALCLTLIVGFVTIGIAWLAVRPIIGISCLVIAACGIFLLIKNKKAKKNEPPKEEKSEITEN